MIPEKYYIYRLLKMDKVFYVGYTASLKQRESYHKTTYGKEIVLEVIKEIEGTKKEAMDLETYYIIKYKTDGHILENTHHYIKKESRVHTSFAILPDLLADAKELAWQERLTFSSKMEQLVKEWVENAKVIRLAA